MHGDGSREAIKIPQSVVERGTKPVLYKVETAVESHLPL